MSEYSSEYKLTTISDYESSKKVIEWMRDNGDIDLEKIGFSIEELAESYATSGNKKLKKLIKQFNEV